MVEKFLEGMGALITGGASSFGRGADLVLVDIPLLITLRVNVFLLTGVFLYYKAFKFLNFNLKF